MKQKYSQTFTYNESIRMKHVNAGVGCKVCHHKDHKSASKKKCIVCHTGRPAMKIMHTFCKECHMKKDKNNKLLGPITCSGCHLKK